MYNTMYDGVHSTVADISDRLVRSEMIDARVKRPEAEKIVAKRAGVSPSALEQLRRGRLKDVDRIGPKIRKAFVDFLTKQLAKQIAALETELVVAHAVEPGVDFSAAYAAIEAAKRALGR